MELLNIQQIEKYYGSKSSLTKAIDDISFTVEAGEFVAIMGASGSGKTTLLNCISTIDRVTAGHIFLEGADVTKLKGRELNRFRREKLGFIFQDFNLLDTLTAFENIALALSIQKKPAAEIEAAVKKVAEQLNISVRTVDTHKNHIYRKLGISTTVELLRYAEQRNLVSKE